MVFDVLLLDPDTQKTVHHASSCILADGPKEAREKFIRDYGVNLATDKGKNWLIRVHEHTFKVAEAEVH